MTALTKGAHHVGLTVPDCRATADFFVEVLDFDEVGGKPDYPSVFVSDGHTLLTIWQAEDPATVRGFDRKGNVGLHHLALSVADDAALAEVHRRLAKRPDVEMEFTPQNMTGAPLRHLMCTIPGGLRVEFVAPLES